MKNIAHYNYIIKKLRSFFQEQNGFVEVPAQSRVSLIATCEDPRTLSTYRLGNVEYPLPQSGQIWLEYELLRNQYFKGVFCITTSYRDEPVIIEGRHHRIFPTFEFEALGDVSQLKRLMSELVVYLGFDIPKSISYEDACIKYNSQSIETAQERTLCSELGNSLFLENFPLHSNPFWNIKRTKEGLFEKIDLLLEGFEVTISAERSTNIQEMRDFFFSCFDGLYAELLIAKFGKARVIKELEEYLSLPMTARFGGSISLNRLEMALEQSNLFSIPTLHVPHKSFAITPA